MRVNKIVCCGKTVVMQKKKAWGVTAAVFLGGCVGRLQQEEVEVGTTSTIAVPEETGMKASKLEIEELELGKGETASSGALVRVHYTGRLSDGTVFDSSLTRGQPFEFSLGEGEVIAGWDQGVKGMKEGGKRRLVIPPALGYGAQGAGNVIPPNAVLEFEVELLEVVHKQED